LRHVLQSPVQFRQLPPEGYIPPGQVDTQLPS